MRSLPDLAWEDIDTSSPETIPPGFENPSQITNPNSPPLENPAGSLHISSPLPQETQGNPTHALSPAPPPQQNIQCHLPPLKPSQENSGSLPHSVPPPPPPLQQRPVTLSSPVPILEQECLDTMSHFGLQWQEGQDPLLFSQSPHGNPSSRLPPPPQSLPEMGQMVCGNCNELLSYPRGSKYIQCACCQTTNFVLQAHQVGIVNCGKCYLLLIYPYAAKSLRCSSCHYVTKIGPRNLRPPVSVLQGFPAAPQKGLADLK